MNVRLNARLTAIAILFSTSSLMGDDTKPAATAVPATPTAAIPDIAPFLLPSVEEKFASEAAKADAVTAKAEQEAAKAKRIAAEIRLKAYKDKLAEITKTGDFDKAQQVKARITQLENESPIETDKPKQPRGIKIHSATYGVNQSLFDVTEKLQTILAKKKDKTQILVTDELFGDPAPGYAIGNTLIIRYQHGSQIQMTAIYEGKPLSLP